MLQIDDTIISFDLFEEQFVCNLQACKGECCIEGDAGAPLEQDEIEKIQEILPLIWDDLTEVSKEVIRKQGISYIDEDKNPSDIIKNLNIGNAKALIVTENRVEDIVRAARNIPRVTYVSADMLNAYDIIRHDKLIVTQGALERIGEVCS